VGGNSVACCEYNADKLAWHADLMFVGIANAEYGVLKRTVPGRPPAKHVDDLYTRW
jgi:hypothetical protein